MNLIMLNWSSKEHSLFHSNYGFMKTYRCSIDDKLIIVTDLLNPFMPKEFPIDEWNHLAFDRVKSTEVPIGQERVKTKETYLLNSIHFG